MVAEIVSYVVDVKVVKFLLAALLGLSLSACVGGADQIDEPEQTPSAQSPAAVPEPEEVAETSSSEIIPWKDPSTEVLDELAASCGLVPAPTGSIRTNVELVEDLYPISVMVAFTAEGGSLSAEDLQCLLSNAGSGKVLSDFEEGGSVSVEPHTWYDSGVWTVSGGVTEILTMLRIEYLGPNR